MIGVTIGQVARATGLTERQIRYYEEKGYICPARTPGGHRLFGEEDLIVLMKLAQHRHNGKSLGQAMAAITQASTRKEPKERSDSLAVRLFFGLHPEGGKR